MSQQTTIRKLAELVNTPVDKLLEQLAEAGMKFSGPDQVITSAEKLKLHGFLRRAHGKADKPADEVIAPGKITLNRSRKQEITVGGGGQAANTAAWLARAGAGVTLVAAALITAYGCGKEEPKKAAAPAAVDDSVTVKIGHAGPLTGGIAHLGKDDENGVHLAVDEANAKKIKLGGKTVNWVMMSEDDQADPKLGPTIAQKFVDAKVAGVVGHLNSGVTIPASAVYNQAGMPMISGSATNPKLTEQGFKSIFRTVARDDQQGPAIAAYIVNELKLKKVAIADDATAYGEGLANEVEKTLKAAGVDVVAHEKTNDKATDFKAILTKIKAKNPDVIFHGGMDATGGPMLKQARELGIKAAFAFGDGACTDEMGKLAGAAAEGLICSQAGLPASAASNPKA